MAIVQIAENDGVPKVNGTEHLMIFARAASARDTEPAVRPVATAADHQVSVPAAPVAPNDPLIDFFPTSAISPPIRKNEPADARDSIGAASKRPYKLVSVTRVRAVFIGPSGRFVAGKGSTIPGLGKVQDIVWKKNKWEVVVVKR